MKTMTSGTWLAMAIAVVESSYDWENEQWTVPMNLSVSQLVKMGKLPVSLQLGGRYYADKPSGGPDLGPPFHHDLRLSKMTRPLTNKTTT